MISLLMVNYMAFAQKVVQPKITNPEWTKPYPPFQIAGNLYYVGTYELSSYLIVTPKGNILVNTGVASSGPMIKVNIESLGFKFADTKILLNTQAHFDHMGAMAAIKKATGAKMMVDEGDAPEVEDGDRTDYTVKGNVSTYTPVKVDRILHNGDLIKLGGMQLTMLHHPGHTKGSCSFLFDVKDNKRTYRVLIANLPSIPTDKEFSELHSYPNMAKDYAYTFKAMKKLTFDIWVASHAGQFDLQQKHKPGSAYNPAAFMDRKGYDEELKELEEVYLERVKEK